MSYYDHATLMALRLGPWADLPAVKRELDWQRDGADAENIRAPLSRRGRMALSRLWPRRKPTDRRAQSPEPA